MQASIALPRGRSCDPILETASRLAERLVQGKPILRQTITALMRESTGRSDADGGWTLRDGYDSLEIAQTLFVIGNCPPGGEEEPFSTLRRLQELVDSLPTQTVRSESQVELQAFSTPLPLAWLAARAARPSPDDILLEPSAGTGLLAGFASRFGCSLVLNEIDPRRRRCLAHAFPKAALSGHDGELIDDLLDPSVRPTLVLMNPPFARSAGRGGDRNAAARHLCAALVRLAPGGRLVAIMPEGYSDSGSGRALRAKAARCARLRLDALLERGLYSKHGTGIAVRLVVYDKLRDERPAVSVRVSRLEQLLSAVERLSPRATPVSGQCHLSRARPVSLFRRASAGRAPMLPADKVRAAGGGAAKPLSYGILENPAPAQDQVGIYLPYRPSRIEIPGASPHPTPLVESLAMGSIAAPKPTHVPVLPPGLLEAGALSDAQLETLIYAGSAFGRDLPGRFLAGQDGCDLVADADGSSYRCGYFLGDGTGAGKGRQIAGIILDQWLRGKRRHIWLSKSESLLEDARRDWSALGGLPLDIQPLSQWQLAAPVTMGSGILFVTYATLRSGRDNSTRLRQILDWAGEEFDGIVAFDEAHSMANSAGGEGSRGRARGSEQGIAGVRLQNFLPRARILYASATGASDVNNLAYAMRLGLWGPQTAFPDRTAFVEGIRKGGIAAMELVARDLKATGLYAARALSFAGVEYDVLEHRLTSEQISVYDAYADAWAVIHANLSAALESTRIIDGATGATLNSNARAAALSRFEGCKQRFFSQLLLSMKLPSLVPAIQADLEAGHAVVVQLVSTSEAMLDRRLASLAPGERESLDIDLSPRDHVIDYLTAAFPTRQMRVFTDCEGNSRSEPMSDEHGRPVHSREALRARDELVEKLCALPPIGTALDTLIERFGTVAVAEVTGRARRLVIDSDGAQKIESRSGRSNLVETEAFMRGDKKILVFSEAGGTGRSYHACLSAANRARRIHYLLEPGWRADAAIQGLGRTHRTRQASAPLFRPVTTDVRGERRFISTIARRLDSLGALTRGQRQTGGQNLFDPADNLESRYAKDALLSWYRLLYAGKLESVSFRRFEELTGLSLEARGGGLREDLPPIQRWLNRLLALRIALQNAIFDEFLGLVEARVAAAREAGTLDLGVETTSVDSLEILDGQVISTDPNSGAETRLLRLEIVRRLRPTSLDRLLELQRSRPDGILMMNARSGRAALRIDGRSLLSEEGLPLMRYELIRPLKREYLQHERLEESSWTPVGEEAFRKAWNSETAEAEATVRRETLHLATGLLLPVWDKLPDEHAKVIRIAAADGRSLLGRRIPTAFLGELRSKFGLDMPLDIEPRELASSVLRSGRPIQVPGLEQLVLKRSLVNGSQRLELTDFPPSLLPWYKAQGCFTEIIRYKTRLFVPVDRAPDVLARLIPSPK
jgi:predicted RNA methylase